MGAAASAVLAAAVESPPPFSEYTHEGRLLLEHKKLSSHTLSSIAAYIYFSGVHTLVLAENDVSENLANTVVKVMKKCRGIRCFVLRKAFIGEDGIKKICKAMMQLNSDPKKQRCDVSSFTLCSDPVDARGVSHLSRLLSQRHCSLQHLDLSQNVLGDEGCTLLAKSLATNTLLRVLDLSCNLLVDEGVVALADMLQSNGTLCSLDISNNMFGDSPVLFLTDALKTNSTLQTLKLNFCGIGDVGACLLGKALTLNSGLRVLFVDSNSFEAKGAESIVDALEANATLTALSLDGNNLGGEIAKHLSRSLTNNCTLTALSMKQIHIKESTQQALAAALANNETLKTFQIS